MQILITRPLQQSEKLAEKIREAGKVPIIFPAMTVIDIPDSGQIQLEKTISELSQYDIIIFISPNAVEKFSQYIGTRPLPEKIRLFAVGKTTAELIQKKNWGNARYPENHFTSGALLDLPELQQLQSKKILLCQGLSGSLLLYDTLRARGANVTQAFLYQRVLPSIDTLPILDNIDLIICTSGESLENLYMLFGDGIKTKSLLLSSPRLKNIAQKLGFTGAFFLAENASDEVLMSRLGELN